MWLLSMSNILSLKCADSRWRWSTILHFYSFLGNYWDTLIFYFYEEAGFQPGSLCYVKRIIQCLFYSKSYKKQLLLWVRPSGFAWHHGFPNFIVNISIRSCVFCSGNRKKNDSTISISVISDTELSTCFYGVRHYSNQTKLSRYIHRLVSLSYDFQMEINWMNWHENEKYCWLSPM